MVKLVYCGGENMAVSKAQMEATAKYEAKKYDKILVRLPKGTKDKIEECVKPNGGSVNGFISRAIEEAIERPTSNKD